MIKSFISENSLEYLTTELGIRVKHYEDRILLIGRTLC